MATFSRTIAADQDNANQSGSTVVLTGFANVDATNEYYGLRFPNVTIDAGVTISACTIRVYCPVSTNDEPNHTIYGDASTNAAVFTTGSNNISARTPTSASTTWSSTNLGAAGFFTTPDLSAILQEIIDTGGWASGNAVAFVIQGSADGTRDLQIAAYEGGAGALLAARLDVTYSLPSAGYSFGVAIG